jgi:predicted nucleic acid-binding protein
MREGTQRKASLSKPAAVFFDTGPLISLFNINPSEKHIVSQTFEHLDKLPHASRHIVGPSLVELFYKLRKLMSPKDVKRNLDAVGITLFPVVPKIESEILSSYCEINYKNEFDYADFFLCRAALFFKHSQILTIDRDDLPLAFSKAYESRFRDRHLELIPFR